MSGPGWMVAISRCWGCKLPFAYDPERVMSVLIDPVTQLAADMDGADPSRAQREPLCPRCCKQANVWRREAGSELLDEIDTAREPPR